ncbi:putative long chain acyl-CoA synthetase 1-like [Capsicum annuum]|nr:putative long chain acyl-CoA synthetase 1-like [Capsicum annuum]
MQRKRCQELGEEKKGGALEKLRRLKSPTTGNKDIALENAADVTQKRSTRKETDVPVIIGLECTKVRSSKTKRTRQINNESLEPIGDQKQIDAAVEGIQEENKQLGDEEGSSQKKRRGRPPRKLLNALEDMQPSGDHSKDEILDPVELAIMVNEDGKEQLEVPAGPSKKRGRTKKMTPTKMSSEKAIQSSSQQHEKHYVKREKRQAKSLNIESQAQGSVDSSAVKTAESNKIATECEEALAEIPFNGFDDQPLAKWFEEIQSPTSVDGLSKLLTFH